MIPAETVAKFARIGYYIRCTVIHRDEEKRCVCMMVARQ